ncbi:gamma-glutamyltransferase [candidate division TA06 bacterium]|nr:gamma-glutamyltransferase [candidate division TA06 bacterium]
MVTPALEIAEGGFPIPASLHRALSRAGDTLVGDEGGGLPWPSTREIFLPGDRPLDTGEILVQKDLARTFQRLIQVENDNASKGRGDRGGRTTGLGTPAAGSAAQLAIQAGRGSRDAPAG